MEAHVAASEDVLVNSLEFKVGKSGSYITDSKSIRFPCESANRFSPTSQRLLRFRLTTPNWLDPLTVRLAFDLRNLDAANPVQLLSTKGITLFNRMRVIAGSTVVEDIDYLARYVSMWDRLKPVGRIMNEMILNGGAAQDATLALASGTIDAIAASDARTYVCELPAGLFQQHKFLPVWAMGGGLVVELELNSDATYATTGATDWILENPYIFAEEKVCDSQLQQRYVQHIMSGKNLPISIKSVSNTLHIVTSGDFTLALARGFSRLDSLFITLFDTEQAGAKEVNTYFHPAGNAALTKANDSLSLQVQIGSKKWPEYPCNSVAEFYMRLQQVLGMHVGSDSMNINSRQYHSNAFICGIDFEKLSSAGAEFTGVNSKEQLLTSSLKNCGSANRCFVTLAYSAVLNIREGGVEVLE